MTKQTITLGNTVDDGTGMYLRQGGAVINENFDDIYGRLGDGETVHPSGAWQLYKFSTSGNALTVAFGDAYAIDTLGGQVNITLPKGTAADYGKTIRLRDVNGTWQKYPITLVIQTGDTVKGTSGTYEISRQYSDVELVYTSPSRFEFAAQKLVNSISLGDTPSVIRKAWLATEGETDFDIETTLGGEYNIAAFEVYRRGNLLYYGNTGLNDSSDYGSIPDASITAWVASTAYAVGDRVYYDPDWYECATAHTAGLTFDSQYWTQLNNGLLFPLDGKTLRLRFAASLNDPIAIVTYLTDVSSFRTSYTRSSILVSDVNNPELAAVDGQIVKVDLSTNTMLTLTQFGFPDYTEYNPDAVEIYVNGVALTPASEAGTGYYGIGDFDYDIIQDTNGSWNTIVFDYALTDNDIVTIKWFDSVIGTLLEWDTGNDNIQDRTDARYLQTLYTFDRKNKIQYTDTDNPSAANVEVIPETEDGIRWDEVTSLLESIYPVGSIYFNANNPNNPADYMGFGKWVRYGEGKAIVSWQDADSQGQYDSDFGYNNQYLDDNDNPIPAAGGTIGSKSVTLTAAMIPELTSGLDNEAARNPNNANEQYALVSRPNDGKLNLNGCQPDPDSTDTALGYYAEEPIRVNAGQTQTNVPIIQPSITVHVWVRTE